MIPNITQDIEVVQENTKTYHFDMEKNIITGYADNMEALKQWVYYQLNTERYKYPCLPPYIGVELESLIGKQIPYVLPELKRRISEALLIDDRIKSVGDFEFDVQHKKVTCNFVIYSIYGNIELEKEVVI